ncbi:hypothetical protein FRX31_015022 [Thalictrum thalictroides]|uniref:Uncharacterized protein n=1 Tax=Thalictrum thalictroides TaxID=46969 RepID=A0A7J6WDH6_THATH|nr:hypothetical protein FRX31_015022 [Thalictrum thalictroides]
MVDSENGVHEHDVGQESFTQEPGHESVAYKNNMETTEIETLSTDVVKETQMLNDENRLVSFGEDVTLANQPTIQTQVGNEERFNSELAENADGSETEEHEDDVTANTNKVFSSDGEVEKQTPREKWKRSECEGMVTRSRSTTSQSSNDMVAAKHGHLNPPTKFN